MTDISAADASAPAGVTSEEAERRQAAAKRMASAFGEIVTLLMRSAADKHRSLADLEWLVAPALIRGQYVVAEARSKETGAIIPAATVLWALVSPEVDARLSDVGNPLRLQPDEWLSGDIPWIVQAVGDNRVLAGLLQQVVATPLKGRQPKMRARGSDGKVSAGLLQFRERQEAPAA